MKIDMMVSELLRTSGTVETHYPFVFAEHDVEPFALNQDIYEKHHENINLHHMTKKVDITMKSINTINTPARIVKNRSIHISLGLVPAMSMFPHVQATNLYIAMSFPYR